MPITPSWLRAAWPTRPVPDTSDPAAPAASRSTLRDALVPIRVLRERHRPRIVRHLLALMPEDRYLRFGYAATDEQVARYAQLLDFKNDELLGIFNRRLQLVAMAHVAYGDPRDCAEFGVSVLASVRGRGLGARLFARAVVLARNRGVARMLIHALTENAPMLRIARSAGARVECLGSESEAYLQLPPGGLDTRLGALLAAQLGTLDYRRKQYWGHLRRLLQDMHEIRQGVRSGRHQAAE